LLALILGTQTCRKHEKYVYDIGAIASALESGAGCKDWGGRLAAETLKKKMEAALHSLKYHVDLLHTQRKNVSSTPFWLLFVFRARSATCTLIRLSLLGKKHGR